MESKHVSIITPSYNQGEFIKNTLRSVKNQTYTPIEHIVVDGGSTDDTINILTEYEDRYNLNWISESDDGQAEAIKKGFRMASGDVYCWINSDDTYLTNTAISNVINYFEKYPNADVVTGQGMMISSDGQWDRTEYIPENKISLKHQKYGQTILQPATFWRAYVSENIEFDTSLRYAFDWDYFIKMFDKYNVLPIHNHIAGYRMWGENKTASGGSERARELQEVTGRYIGRTSWQYYTLGLFCLFYSLGESFPNPVGDKIITFTSLLSSILRKKTYGRITRI
jgi:glycosyltransferase involved in cell wall biosynthesis